MTETQIEGGICRRCGLRRNVFKLNRRMEQTSRQNRVYPSRICRECAGELVTAGVTDRFDPLALARIAAYNEGRENDGLPDEESPAGSPGGESPGGESPWW